MLDPPSFSFVSSGPEEAVCPESRQWRCDIKQGLLVPILDCADILEIRDLHDIGYCIFDCADIIDADDVDFLTDTFCQIGKTYTNMNTKNHRQ